MGRHPLGRALFDDLKWRGLVHQVTDAELPTLLEHERFTLYIGFDPSVDSLHAGHLQELCLLRRFAEAGHRPIGLVGGGTGMIGDPSGQSEERALLAPDTLAANSRAVHAQIAGFLDGSTDDALLVDNQEWLGSVVLVDFLRDVGKLFTVNEMVRKDSVRSRLEDREQGLSFAEFAYQLCQAWDFVQLYERYGCRLQLGGSDQWGNITEGVALVRRMAQATAYGLTSPLVTKADGTKFGKTGTGTVWLDPARTSPYAFYQFWYRVPDADVGGYLRRFTFLERAEVERLDEATAKRPEQREAQRVLARDLTTMVHGARETGRVEEAARVLFTPDVNTLDAATLAAALADAPTTELDVGRLAGGVELVDAVALAGLAPSKGRARREITQGGIYVNGHREPDPARILRPDDALHGRFVLLRRGRATQHVLVAHQ